MQDLYALIDLNQQDLQNYIYQQPYVRMRHICSNQTKQYIHVKKINSRQSQVFQKVFCQKWQQMMLQKRQRYKTFDDIYKFDRYFYHSGDLAYKILKIDALKLLMKTPLNTIKESIWKNRFNARMPQKYKKDNKHTSNTHQKANDTEKAQLKLMKERNSSI